MFIGSYYEKLSNHPPLLSTLITRYLLESFHGTILIFVSLKEILCKRGIAGLMVDLSKPTRGILDVHTENGWRARRLLGYFFCWSSNSVLFRRDFCYRREWSSNGSHKQKPEYQYRHCFFKLGVITTMHRRISEGQQCQVLQKRLENNCKYERTMSEKTLQW